MVPQFRRTDENTDKVADVRRPAHLDAERGPDHATAPAAIDEIIRRDLKPLVACAVVHRRDDVVAGFANRFQATAVAQFDVVEARGELRQDGVEEELIATLRTFRALFDRLTAAMGGPLDARDFMTGERRAIE